MPKLVSKPLILVPSPNVVDDHQDRADHKPGNDAAGKQRADRYAARVGQDDHRDARRNDATDGRAYCGDTRGKRRGVAGLLHGRNHQ